MSEPQANPEPQPTRPSGRPPVNPGSFGPPAPPAPIVYAAPPAGGRLLTRILLTLLVLSLIANLYLGSALSAFLNQSDYVPIIEGDREHRIVVLPVVGMIDDTTAAVVRGVLQDLRENKPKALILRIDSGGGTVGASDRIWNELARFRQETEIPIVASFGSIAASGGYYIAAGADHIIAEPTCITGSIGVMANVMTFDRLLDKVGVTPEVLVAQGSPEKDVANNVFRPWNDRDRQTVQTILDHAHSRFVQIVSQGRGRHLTTEQVQTLANGEVYTAQEAVNNKLIDGEGYLTDAVAQAAALAGLPATAKPHVEVYAPRPGLLSAILSDPVPPNASERTPIDLTRMDSEQLRRTLVELTTPRLEYRFNLMR